MILHGDCLDKLKTFPTNYFDAIVTDPPYGLSFMGKKWDYDVPSQAIWEEALRVLKPGGHLLAFFGTRTYHRGVVRIEDAGFEIRDQIQWLYGSGFPKSHNLKEVREGWGTALKPANEPIVLARKPIEKGLTIAQNVAKWGTGGINVDGSRIESGSRPKRSHPEVDRIDGVFKSGFVNGCRADGETIQGRFPSNVLLDEEAAATMPLDSQGESVSRYFYCAKASKGERNAGLEKNDLIWETEAWEKPDLKLALKDMLELAKGTSDDILMDDSSWSTDGSGCSSADQSQKAMTFIISMVTSLTTALKTLSASQSSLTRENIQDAIKMIEASGLSLAESADLTSQSLRNTTSERTASLLGVVHAQLKALSKIRSFAKQGNFHSTVKPLKLMQCLITLITPPNGIVLDPFAGSGSTLVAAKKLGFGYVGIEREKEYCEIAEKRLEAV